MSSRYVGLPWIQSGIMTRQMKSRMEECACTQSTKWVGSIVYSRDPDDFYHIINDNEWNFAAMGPVAFPLVDNSDQMAVQIWRDLPQWVIKDKTIPRSDDSRYPSRFFASKDLFHCNEPTCGRIISWDSTESKCIFCGFSNDLSTCEPFGVPADKNTMEKVYPDRIGPIFRSVRDWFRDIPGLDKLGLTVGIVTFRGGMHLRRQLKVVPKPVYRDSPNNLGWLIAGESNKTQMTPENMRYDYGNKDEWYNSMYRNFHTIKEPEFNDKGHLLGDLNTAALESGSVVWI